MSRPRRRKGVYYDAITGDVKVWGYRRDSAPAGNLAFAEVTNPAERALLIDRDIDDLMWDGAAVVLKPQSEIDRRLEAEAEAADDSWLNKVVARAFLEVLLNELNELRAQHGLPARTPAQARGAIKQRAKQLREGG